MEVTEGPSGYARERISQAKRDERPRLIDRATTGRSSRRQEGKRPGGERSTHTHASYSQDSDYPSSNQNNKHDKTLWPSGLRRWSKVPVRKGVGSNPTGVTFLLSLFFSYESKSHTNKLSRENSLVQIRISLASLFCHCKSVRKKASLTQSIIGRSVRRRRPKNRMMSCLTFVPVYIIGG